MCRVCDEEMDFKDVKPTLVCPNCFKRFCERINTCPKRNYGLSTTPPSMPKLLVKVFDNHQSAMSNMTLK